MLLNPSAQGRVCFRFFFCLMISGLLLQWGGQTAWAQQNLFNIPSGEITPGRGVFYQHQLNLYSPQSLESKSHVVVGVGHGLEVGLNVVNVAVNLRPAEKMLPLGDRWHGKPLGPLVLLTAQKGFSITPKLHASVGFQAGGNATPHTDHLRPAGMIYGLMLWQPAPRLKLTGGVGAANRYLLGTGRPVVGLVGYEWKLSRRFWLMGDWIVGDVPSAVAVLGGLVNLGAHVQLCAGWMLPGPWTPQTVGHALVLELNLLLWDTHAHGHQPH